MNRKRTSGRLALLFMPLLFLTCAMANEDSLKNKDINGHGYNAKILLRIASNDVEDAILPDIFIKIVNTSNTDFAVRDVHGLFNGLITVSTNSARHVLINKRREDALVRSAVSRDTFIAPGEYMLYQVRFYEYEMTEYKPGENRRAWWRDVRNEREVLVRVEPRQEAIMPAELVVHRNKKSEE